MRRRPSRQLSFVDISAFVDTHSLKLLAAVVTVSGLEVLSTTWKSTDGTASHWKYIIGNVIVYRDVYRGIEKEKITIEGMK
jgi:hypothetical protein